MKAVIQCFAILASRITRLTMLVGALLFLAACNSDNPSSSTASSGESLELRKCLIPPVYTKPAANPLRNAYFGELHLHTQYSMDAYATLLKPRDSYCFATGYPVAVPPYDAAGNSLVPPLKIDRPLDFAAVTDHAEWLGETRLCTDPTVNTIAYNSAECLVYRNSPENGFLLFGGGWTAFAPLTPTFDLNNLLALLTSTEHHRPLYCGLDGSLCRQTAKSVWEDVNAQAENFNRPGLFTTFHAYEYTLSPLSDNLHRNVIFRTDVVPELPISAYEAPTAPDMWAQLDVACTKEKNCEYLTIPHNSNISNGRMFKQPNAQEDGYDAAERAKHEPMIEIFQVKGDSECINTAGGSPDDPLCGFEKLASGTFLEYFLGVPNVLPTAPAATNYVRYALAQGMLIEEDFGANPFQYGFGASTDSHFGLPGAVDESSFPGHRDIPPAIGVKDEGSNNPGGVTGVWAEENTRDSLFSAMQRRETFGTSGPRMRMRVFGGSANAGGLPADLCSKGGDEYARVGYAKGVPMGGELPSNTTRPRMAVWALADSLARENGRKASVPLAKIQIIKGWVERDSNGNRTTREQVFDVANSASNWKLNEDDCSVSGTGSGQLCAVWDDPQFDPKQRAFYYARAVEAPTCRWLTRQCMAAPANLNCSNPPAEWASCCDVQSGQLPKAIQERAWASPIWFKPAQ